MGTWVHFTLYSPQVAWGSSLEPHLPPRPDEDVCAIPPVFLRCDYGTFRIFLDPMWYSCILCSRNALLIRHCFWYSSWCHSGQNAASVETYYFSFALCSWAWECIEDVNEEAANWHSSFSDSEFSIFRVKRHNCFFI